MAEDRRTAVDVKRWELGFKPAGQQDAIKIGGMTPVMIPWTGEGEPYVAAEVYDALLADLLERQQDEVVLQAREKTYRDGWQAGFEASGEGWNGEYLAPDQEPLVRKREDEDWIAHAAALAKGGE